VRYFAGSLGSSEQVLDVRVRDRQAPGDRIVLAEDEDRGAQNHPALDRPLGRDDTGEIPEDRRAEIEMRIVGEDRLSGLRPRSGDHPFVRGALAYSRQSTDLVVDAFAGRVSVPEGGKRRDRLAGLGGRKQPVRLVRPELLEEPGALELELEVLRQLIGLELRNDQAIGRPPRFGSIAG
jgi:hypothetical protein